MDPRKLLALAGRRLLTHVGGLLGSLAPIVVQLLTHRVGWPEAEALSSAVIVTWLLAMAHVSGKLAGTILADLQALAQPGNTGPDLGKLLQDLMGSLGGGLGPGAELAHMPVPPGLAHLFPSGQPAATPTETQGPVNG